MVVRFKSQVLTYSTNFGGAVRLSTAANAFQALTPGNTAFLGEGDDPDKSGTAVLSPVVLASSRLLDGVVMQPNPFSPNGDGVNDRLEVLYNLLAVTAPTPVSIKVHDLGGRTVAVIRDAEQNQRKLQRHFLGWTRLVRFPAAAGAVPGEESKCRGMPKRAGCPGWYR